MDVQRVLAAIAEPTRFRIVQLLASAPRTVGEIAMTLGTLQPQTTKHLQAMEAAGVITVHRLGRRRIASLRRDVLEELAGNLGSLAASIPEEPALAQYERAIAAEEGRQDRAEVRTLTFARDLPVPPSRVWRAWTEPGMLRGWWAPEHFEVVECEIAPAAGEPIRIVLGEADGAEYVAIGRVLGSRPDHEFVFELAPVDGAGVPLFRATYTLRLAGESQTELSLEIEVSDVRPEAGSAVAGLEVGMPQLLAQLEAVLR